MTLTTQTRSRFPVIWRSPTRVLLVFTSVDGVALFSLMILIIGTIGVPSPAGPSGSGQNYRRELPRSGIFGCYSRRIRLHTSLSAGLPVAAILRLYELRLEPDVRRGLLLL